MDDERLTMDNVDRDMVDDEEARGLVVISLLQLEHRQPLCTSHSGKMVGGVAPSIVGLNNQ